MEEETILESIFFDREQRVLANVSDEERNVILEIKRDGNEDKLRKLIEQVKEDRLRNKIEEIYAKFYNDMDSPFLVSHLLLFLFSKFYLLNFELNFVSFLMFHHI